MALPEPHPDRRPGSENTLIELYDLVPAAADLTEDQLLRLLGEVLGAQVLERRRHRAA